MCRDKSSRILSKYIYQINLINTYRLYLLIVIIDVNSLHTILIKYVFVCCIE